MDIDTFGARDIMELVSSMGAPAIAVIVGMKYALNGMRGDVKDIREVVKDLMSCQQFHATRLAVLEDHDHTASCPRKHCPHHHDNKPNDA